MFIRKPKDNEQATSSTQSDEDDDAGGTSQISRRRNFTLVVILAVSLTSLILIGTAFASVVSSTQEQPIQSNVFIDNPIVDDEQIHPKSTGPVFSGDYVSYLQELKDKREIEEREKEAQALFSNESNEQQPDAVKLAPRRDAVDEYGVGMSMAQLASFVSPTAVPMSSRLQAPGGSPYNWSGDARLNAYKRLCEDVKANSPRHKGAYNNTRNGAWDNWAWASCHQAACVIIRAVADKDMPMDNPTVCKHYFSNNPDKWAYVGSTSRSDDAMLQPGDILNITSPFTHTMIYLGHDVAQECNPGTTGVIWEASYNSKGAFYPGITDKGANGSFGATYDVYRYIGTPGGCVDLNAYM